MFAVGPSGEQTAAGFHIDSFLLQQDAKTGMRGGGGRGRDASHKESAGWAVPAGLATFERVHALLRQGVEGVVPNAGGVVPQKLMAALEGLATSGGPAAHKRRSRKATRVPRRRGTRKQLGRKAH